MKKVTYQHARKKLLAYLTEDRRICSNGLYRFVAAVRVITAIKTVHPRNYKKKIAPILKSLSRFYVKDDNKTNDALLEGIHKHLFPVNEMMMDMGEYDLGEDFYIHIGSMETKVSSDRFDEWMSDDPVDLSDGISFDILLGYLWGNTNDPELYWKIYNKRFKWGISKAPPIPGNLLLEWDMFKEKLEEKGLVALYYLMESISGDTDNLFFDYDYEYYQPIDFTTENLITLNTEWKEAQEFWAICLSGYELLKDPKNIQIFVEEYLKCLTKERKPHGS